MEINLPDFEEREIELLFLKNRINLMAEAFAPKLVDMEKKLNEFKEKKNAEKYKQ